MGKSKYKIKNQIIYEIIRDAIISGEFAPGTRLVIDNLALRYDVSHSPIRECLRLLEAEGFVTVRPFAGVTITELQPELIIEVFALLESLEIISSCRASNRANCSQIDELRQMIDDMDHCISEADQWSAKNVELHMTICDIAEMTIAKNMMHSALLHWDRLRRHYLEEVSARRIGQAQQEHRELLKAMQSGDEKQIESVIQLHNKAALHDYLQHIRETQQVDLSLMYPFG